ncbi:Glutaredoxin-like domain (DUF836) [Mycolicibacterium gilvum Spyr1]|uniref:Glutaredoxin-like domain (DUF836) n=1 Tax=Mycolicibacterium gilvum (strain DSM 45189 / LMG 24558 / Spyr1) TaxID=278137 RepID=E6TBW1_MYCSR|nr:Glutaredoxin-like domain (DUF836) [Mycolicibacterium gilvum Spyr1]
MCAAAAAQLDALAGELGFTVVVTDVDAAAAAGDAALRAEYGDRLPVVLLDGVEHSYWGGRRSPAAGRSERVTPPPKLRSGRPALAQSQAASATAMRLG